jgi:hypothetical protein
MQDMKDRVPKLRGMSETAFGRFLRKNGCTRWRTAMARGWEFPPLAKMRKQWEKGFGRWEWEEEIMDWQ